ncbi:MAG: hypothetical protein ACREE0_05930 [Phenylobacterium sp.]
MTDPNHAIRDDIAFMRALAEEGRHTPMLGGSVLLAAGLIFGAANGIGAWLTATDTPFSDVVWTLPLSGVVVFMIVLAILKARLGGRPGASSPVNRATGSMWRAVGWSIMLMVVSLCIASWRLDDWRLMAAVPIIVFMLYGAGWQVAAAMTRSGWLRWVAFGSYATALLTAWFASDPVASSLVSTVGLLALAAAPGYVLMRQAPSLIV